MSTNHLRPRSNRRPYVALAAALVIASPRFEAPHLFAQQVRPIGLSVTSVQLSAMPAALVVPLTPSVFSVYWAAPTLAVVAAPITAAPVIVSREGDVRSERMRRIAAGAVYHFQSRMEPGAAPFDLVGNTLAHVGPSVAVRRVRARRFRGVLEESSNLNDPAIEAKRIDTMAKPSHGHGPFDGLSLWEIPTSLMTALVLTTIAAVIKQKRRTVDDSEGPRP